MKYEDLSENAKPNAFNRVSITLQRRFHPQNQFGGASMTYSDLVLISVECQF